MVAVPAHPFISAEGRSPWGAKNGTRTDRTRKERNQQTNHLDKGNSLKTRT